MRGRYVARTDAGEVVIEAEADGSLLVPAADGSATFTAVWELGTPPMPVGELLRRVGGRAPWETSARARIARLDACAPGWRRAAGLDTAAELAAALDEIDASRALVRDVAWAQRAPR